MKTDDLRVRRTEKTLKDSLLNLLQSKSLRQITVNDIADAAMVHRTTFYAHYTDKYALLESIFDSYFHNFNFTEFEVTPFKVIIAEAMQSISHFDEIYNHRQDDEFQALLVQSFIKQYRQAFSENDILPLEKWFVISKLFAITQWNNQPGIQHDLRTDYALLDKLYQQYK
ncbi:TetR/AcrR family transcriptional regulator [Periweissella cryptocerci]|uniref:TetR/AcrR family transcriptional regulator n=1 Tax=Periweissella cryptocerci TaxID=2506420 RepID=A0A4P6YU59_9LACO|nr:TetR/AcrR family transcriptional regulator [Periweissella cryptocerci]QBO36241.1 TetR/AcrR family transcriptional regulator [Periweissella cryptocerci]